ncbi:MAG: PadR family transcriptional regulator [Microbacteriaceae bacterium]|nr:PadR family transcriptional regulator [Microbacteriaceae bacterium]
MRHHQIHQHPHHDHPLHRAEFPGFGRGGEFPGFPPFGPRRRPKGDVRAAILAILAADGVEAVNGYGIMKAIGEQTEGAWTPSPGSVYPTLQQLVDEGLIAPTGEGRKTEYALTEEGRAYTAEHAEELASWATAQRPSDAARALMESAGRLMAVLGQFRHAATDAQRAAAAEQLDATRKALYLILAE